MVNTISRAQPDNSGLSKPTLLFTIGHSNRSFEDFQLLLKEFEIEVLADVRRFPSSRKFPHFNQKVLRQLLDHQRIQYVWFEALGGHRHTKKNERSPNTGLIAPGFRNYADYMMTGEFQVAVSKLLLLGKRLPTAVMCAEKFFWKCHRRLLSDFLVAQGVEVAHIFDQDNLRPHKLTPGAAITNQGTVIYPKPNDVL